VLQGIVRHSGRPAAALRRLLGRDGGRGAPWLCPARSNPARIGDCVVMSWLLGAAVALPVSGPVKGLACRDFSSWPCLRCAPVAPDGTGCSLPWRPSAGLLAA